MAKRVVRVTMPICSALMHTDFVVRDAYCVSRKGDCPRTTQYAIRNTRCGFTLTELAVVVVIISLVVLVAQVRLFGLLRRSTFKAQVQEFISTMQMAARAAAQSDRRYEVIVNLTEQSYLLREINSPDLSEVLQEEIIVEGNLGKNCWIAYVEFDDGEYTNEGKAKFRAGHAGWQYGGKIVLLDENERPYSVVVERMNRIVKLQQGEAALLVPKAQSEIPF
jgi:prepilin-type N-terminal cleavage/methylation domain-containing protein